MPSADERLVVVEVTLKAHLDYCVRHGEELAKKMDALVEKQASFYKWMAGGMGAILLILLANLVTHIK